MAFGMKRQSRVGSLLWNRNAFTERIIPGLLGEREQTPVTKASPLGGNRQVGSNPETPLGILADHCGHIRKVSFVHNVTDFRVRSFAGTTDRVRNSLHELALVHGSRHEHLVRSACGLGTNRDSESIRQPAVNVFYLDDGLCDSFELNRVRIVSHLIEEFDQVPLRNSHAALETFLGIFQASLRRSLLDPGVDRAEAPDPRADQGILRGARHGVVAIRSFIRRPLSPSSFDHHGPWNLFAEGWFGKLLGHVSEKFVVFVWAPHPLRLIERARDCCSRFDGHANQQERRREKAESAHRVWVQANHRHRLYPRLERITEIYSLKGTLNALCMDHRQLGVNPALR